MCGIFTVFSKKEKLDQAACARALSRLRWRGPDYSYETVWKDRLYLGQTILSLTGDISATAGRHLTSESGRYSISFNGEIYNFSELAKRFFGKAPATDSSDVQVLVDLLEKMTPQEVMSQLDGMYAFVVLDREKDLLYIARDPQGEKSLYIYEDAQRFVISSEVAPIRALNPEIGLNPQVFRDYFSTRHFMQAQRTVFRGIEQILPGELRTLDLQSGKFQTSSRIRISDWIDPERFFANTKRSSEDLVNELDEILDQCTKQMIPRGRDFSAVVSGGVDSSLLARYILKHGDPKCLIAVNHVGKDQISSNLKGFEKSLSRSIDVIEVDAGQYAGEISRCQNVVQSPLLSHSFIGQSIQSDYVRRKGCRILFGGEGADELFGGYDAYLPLLSLKNKTSVYSPSPYTNYKTPNITFCTNEGGLLAADLAQLWQESLSAYADLAQLDNVHLQATLYADFSYQLPAVGLRSADLMSMMWSVETRSIFVRKPLVAFVLNLPSVYKVAGDRDAFGTKSILKKVFTKFYAPELLVPKQGFSGFPNESIKYLSAVDQFATLEFLDIDRSKFDLSKIDRDSLWKLINVEYFLRGQFC